MTDPFDDHVDFDARLRTLLAVKAGEVEPALSGPDLRRLGSDRTSGVRRLAAVVSAAAAVIVVALATQHLGESRAPQRAPAGHPDTTPSTSAPLHSAPQPTPAHRSRPSPTPSPTPRSSPAPTASVMRPSAPPTSARSGTDIPTSPTTVPTSSAAPSAPTAS